MSKILLFSDLHICTHKQSVDRLHHCLDALEWVFQTAKERQINDIVFGGDLFQSRQKIDLMTYHLTFDVLYKHCNKNLRLWLLLGNHDLWFHDRWDISSVRPFAAIPGITVIGKPTTLAIGNNNVDFLPYTQQPIEHLTELLQKPHAGYRTLIAHLAVDGAKLNTLHNTYSDVVIEHDGEMTCIDHKLFKDWDKVWLGHYHGTQKVGTNAEYIGSTLQLNFGEAFQHKHIIIYDPANGNTEYVKNTFSPQHFIIPESDIAKYDIRDNFIRLAVKDIGRAEIIDLKQELRDLKAGSIEILPCAKENQDHIVDDATAILHEEDKILAYMKQTCGNLEQTLLTDIMKRILCVN